MKHLYAPLETGGCNFVAVNVDGDQFTPSSSFFTVARDRTRQGSESLVSWVKVLDAANRLLSPLPPYAVGLDFTQQPLLLDCVPVEPIEHKATTRRPPSSCRRDNRGMAFTFKLTP